MKLFIASVIVLLGIICFLFALFPPKVSVSRMAVINAPQDSVMGRLSDLRSWASWNVLLADSGNRRVDGFVVSSDSNRLQSPKLTIFLVRTTKDSVITRWVARTGKSFNAVFVLSHSGGTVTVQWGLYFHLRWYPWEKMASMFYDKQLGPLMEQSLENLRKTMRPA